MFDNTLLSRCVSIGDEFFWYILPLSVFFFPAGSLVLLPHQKPNQSLIPPGINVIHNRPFAL
jgi:hypothetical protein